MPRQATKALKCLKTDSAVRAIYNKKLRHSIRLSYLEVIAAVVSVIL